MDERYEMDIMVDLETVGKFVAPAFFAIGAVRFYPEGKAPPLPKEDWDGENDLFFYRLIHLSSAEKEGLSFDADTMYWWLNQSSEAIAELRRSDKKGRDLCDVLEKFTSWSMGCKHLWAHGSDFDIAILRTTHHILGFKFPFNRHDFRDCRTLFSVLGKNKDAYLPKEGIEHHALFDAYRQAVGVQNFYKELRSLGK